MASLFDARKVLADRFKRHYEKVCRSFDYEKEKVKLNITWRDMHTDLQAGGTSEFDVKEFGNFYRKKTTKLSIQILSTTLFLLLFAILILAYRPLKFGEVVQYRSLFAWMSVWMLFTTICLVYFLIMGLFPNLFSPTYLDWLWKNIAALIIISKVCIIIRTGASKIFFNDYCYGVAVAENELQVVDYVFIQVIVDLFQSFILSMLPFRWPFIAYFSFFQYIEILLRLYSCQKAFLVPERSKIISIALSTLTTYFICSVLLVSYNSQKTIQHTFINLQKQKKAAQENIRFVNLLCRDLKLTTLKYNQSLFNFIASLKIKTSSSYDSIYENFIKLTEMIDSTNRIIDDLVFIIKIIEKRFEFSFSDDFEVLPLFMSSHSGFSLVEENEKDTFFQDILIQLPSTLKIRSNKICLRILFFYSLVLTRELLELRTNQDSSKEKQDGPNKKLFQENKVSIRCEIVTSDPGDSEISFLKFNIEWKGEYHVAVSGEPNNMLDSACLICDTITNSYGKSFSLASTGIEFLFPFKISTLVSFNPLLNLAPDHPDNVKFKQFIIAEICLLISDNHMETLAKDVINHLPGGREIVVIRELQSAAIFAHSIILVQSEIVAKQLREKGFSGKVVLLSEQFSYFSELDTKNVDYGIQLPVTEDGINELTNFFLDLRNERETSPSSSSKTLFPSTASSTSAMDPFSPKKLSQEDTSTRIKKLNRNKSILSSSTQTKTLITIEEDNINTNLQESYYWWRFLSPSTSLFSLDSSLDLIILTTTISYTFFLVLGVFGLAGYVLTMFSCTFVIVRSWIYRKVLSLKVISFRTLYKIFIAFITIGSLVNTFNDFFHIDYDEHGHFAIEFIPTTPFRDFQAYLGRREILRHSGYSSFIFVLNATGYLRYFGEAIPVPYFYPLAAILIIRYYGNVLFFKRANFIPQLLSAVCAHAFLSYIIAFFIYHRRQTELNEKDFLLLHDRLISTDMFERCSFVSKQLLLPRLELFNQAEDRLLEKIADLTKKETLMSDLVALAEESVFDQKCINNRILLLSPEMVRQIQRLQHYRRLTLSLRFSLKTVETRFFPSTESTSVEEKKMELMIDVKAHMLRNVVEEVIQSFIHGGYETVIRYYVVIHPSVAMIRINKDLFTTTLIDLIQQSMSRIEKNFEDLPYLQKVDHQVLIWIQPTRVEDRIIPFSEVRELQMTVLDTGMVKKRRGGGLFEGFEMRVEKGETGSSIFFSAMERPNSASASSSSTPSSLHGLGHSEVVLSNYHKLTDQFLEAFQLPNRSEMGHLFHPQYKSFQKVAFPILLCSLSNEIDSILKRQKTSIDIWKVDPQNLRIYYQYTVEQAENISMVLSLLAQNRSGFTLSSPSLLLTKERISNIKAVDLHYRKLLSQSQNILNSVIGGSPSHDVFKTRSTTTSSSTSSSQSSSMKSTLSSSNIQANRHSSNSSNSNNNAQQATTESIRIIPKKARVKIYCVRGEETNRKRHWISHSFRSRQIVCKYRELEGLPNPTFQDTDIILLEYSPIYVKKRIEKALPNPIPINNNNHKGKSSKSSNYYYRLEMPYNIRNVIHYLRAVGFMGMIVIVHQDPKNKMDGKKLDSFVEGNDETDDFYESNLRNPNAYSDAAKADLQLTLPWNESIVDEIITHWKNTILSQLFLEKSHPLHRSPTSSSSSPSAVK